jgi:hypothetical protein
MTVDVVVKIATPSTITVVVNVNPPVDGASGMIEGFTAIE